MLGFRYIAAIGCVIVASTWIKLVHRPPVRYEEFNPSRKEAVQSSLQSTGFQVVALEDGTGTVVLGGQKDGCILWITWERPEGTDTARNNINSGNTGNTLYLYRGQQTKSRPVVRPFLDWYQFRVFQSVGMSSDLHTIYRVESSGSCDTGEVFASLKAH